MSCGSLKLSATSLCRRGVHSSAAMIQVTVDGRTEITAAQGDGPVHALDTALRKVLLGFTCLADVHLTDYKVRVLEPQSATAAKVGCL